MTGLPMVGLVPPASLTDLPGPVWGVDPSTVQIAVGIVTPGRTVDLAWKTCVLPRASGAARLSLALDVLVPWFIELAAATGPRTVWLEQPFAQAKHVHPQSYFMVGIVLTALHRALDGAASLETTNPAQWKRLAMGEGNGNATKQRIMTWARAVGYTGLSQDEADAIGIATAAGVHCSLSRAAAA